MNNPLRILQTLDRHLTHSAEITLFGRAALALGYDDSPPAFATRNDVDAILPLPWLAAEDENSDFWQSTGWSRAGRAGDPTHAVETLIRQEAAEQHLSR